MSDTASAHANDGSGLVEMTVPMRTDYIATLRIVAASIGADAGFSIDEIDDLRLAISEVVSSLIESTTADGDRIVASFDHGPHGVAVAISSERGEVQVDLDNLASSILQSVVDDYEVAGTRVTLLKLASEAAGVVVPDIEPAAPGA